MMSIVADIQIVSLHPLPFNGLFLVVDHLSFFSDQRSFSLLSDFSMSSLSHSRERNDKPDADQSSDEELSHPDVHNAHPTTSLPDHPSDSFDEQDDDGHHHYQPYATTDGYSLLPQDSNLPEHDEIDDDDQEFHRFATLRVLSSTDEAKTDTSIDPIESAWTTKLESDPFSVDDDKAAYIKSRMSSIKLPESSVPDWTEHCSEQDWQNKLRERIACRQTTFFSDDTR